MGYFIANEDVPVNINMVSLVGVAINDLDSSTIRLTLMKAGVTQNISGMYTISFQYDGVYRVVLNAMIMATPNVDYILIVEDLTGRAISDRVEFTLHRNTIDTVHDNLKVEIDVNEAKLDVLTNAVDEVEGLLKDTTYGLSALKDKADAISAAISSSTVTIQNDIATQANQNETKLDTLIAGQTSQYDAIITAIGVNTNHLLVIKSYVDELESIVKNTTYGLSALKDKANEIDSNLATAKVVLQNEIISQANENEVKIDSASTQILSAINEINVNEAKLDLIITHTDEVEGLLTSATYGLSVLKTKLEELDAAATANKNILQGEIISQANQNETKIDSLTTTITNMESSLTNEINQIPTNPLLTTDSRLDKLATLDTTASHLPDLIAPKVWSYGSRYLSGASGINQIDIDGFSGGFLINHDAVVNVVMIDNSGNTITGRTYPVSLDYRLYKGGVLADTSGLVTITETDPGTYRVVTDGAVIDTPAIDYLMVVSDKLSIAIPQRVEFTAFEIAGAAGPSTVTFQIIDSDTLLPIPDTQVYVKNNAQTLIINKGVTGNDGKYITGLTDGSYQVFLRKTFVDFTTPEPLTVAGDTTSTLYGTSFSASSPSSPATSVVYGWLAGVDGRPIKNAKVTATETQTARYSGSYKIGKLSKATTTDTNGYWELELIRSSQLTPSGIKYKFALTYPGFSYEKDATVPDSSSIDFSSL